MKAAIVSTVENDGHPSKRWHTWWHDQDKGDTTSKTGSYREASVFGSSSTAFASLQGDQLPRRDSNPD